MYRYLKNKAKPIPPRVLKMFALLIMLGIAGWVTYWFLTKEPKVTDFDSCAAAGNPILESYPEQCTHQGKSYTRQPLPKPF